MTIVALLLIITWEMCGGSYCTAKFQGKAVTKIHEYGSMEECKRFADLNSMPNKAYECVVVH